jgi:hypothetical protein
MSQKKPSDKSAIPDYSREKLLELLESGRHAKRDGQFLCHKTNAMMKARLNGTWKPESEPESK